MSLRTQSGIKEEEMDTEQDMNREIKMSGEKMKEENMMTDKKAKRQNPAANNICTSMHRVFNFRKVCQNDDAGNK